MVPEALKVPMEPLLPFTKAKGPLPAFPSLQLGTRTRGAREPGWAQTARSEAAWGRQPSDKPQGWPGDLSGSVTFSRAGLPGLWCPLVDPRGVMPGGHRLVPSAHTQNQKRAP